LRPPCRVSASGDPLPLSAYRVIRKEYGHEAHNDRDGRDEIETGDERGDGVADEVILMGLLVDTEDERLEMGRSPLVLDIQPSLLMCPNLSMNSSCWRTLFW